MKAERLIIFANYLLVDPLKIYSIQATSLYESSGKVNPTDCRRFLAKNHTNTMQRGFLRNSTGRVSVEAEVRK